MFRVAAAALFLAGASLPGSAATLSPLHLFDHVGSPQNGNAPQTTIFYDPVQNALFGATQWGGDLKGCGGSGCGTVYALGADSKGRLKKFRLLHTFAFGDGGSSDGGHSSSPVTDSAGNLYGTTVAGGDASCNAPSGCGTAYMLAAPLLGRALPKEHVMHVFEGSDGANPVSAVSQGTVDGSLYGTASEGGTADRGVVFRLAPDAHRSTWRYTALYDFSQASEGTHPGEPLTLDANGNIFGTTLNGGHRNYGTVFELSPAGKSWTETVLVTFGVNGAGFYPTSGLLADTSGNFIGVTFGRTGHRGADYGNVFVLGNGSGSWSESVVHHFNGSDGGNAWEDHLVRDANGNLFGTTEYGGAQNDGTIFELVNNGGTYKYRKLYDFCSQANCGDGTYPTGLVMDGAGHFFGTTGGGGTNNDGTVFEFMP